MAPETLLGEWRSFYSLIGTCSATLAGLTVVVIALSPDRALRAAGMRVYLTPTIFYFGSALTIAAILCMPGHSPMSLAACLCAGGLVGVVYGFAMTARMYRGRANLAPAVSEWIWNAILPCLCYLALLDAAALAVMRPTLALYVTAAIALLLLLAGIHNLWDMSGWLLSRRVPPQPQDPE